MLPLAEIMGGVGRQGLLHLALDSVFGKDQLIGVGNKGRRSNTATSSVVRLLAPAAFGGST
jgi:hypothetical protein